MRRNATILATSTLTVLCASLTFGHGFELASQYRAVFTTPPVRIPSDSAVDGPLLGNGDLLVAMGGGPAFSRFHIGKNDLWRMPSGGGAAARPLARLDLEMPSFSGASYQVEQTLGDATTVATFKKDGVRLNMRCWVAATEPLLMIELSTEGGKVPVKSSLHVASLSEAPVSSLRNSGNRINLGREQFGEGRWYLNGLLDEVQVYEQALTPGEISSLSKGDNVSAKLVRHWSFRQSQGEVAADESGQNGDGRLVSVQRVQGTNGMALDLDGRSSYVDCPPLNVKKAVTVSAFVFLREGHATQYILSQGEWKKSWSLGLSSGMLRMAVGDSFAQTTGQVPVNRWVHVAGVFDGRQIRVYVDGQREEPKAKEPKAKKGDPESGDGVSWIERRIDENTRVPAAAACAFRVVDGKDQLFTVEPGRPVTLIASVSSRFDAEDYVKQALDTARAVTPRQIVRIRRAHKDWWREYWNKSFVEIPDKFLEQRYYLSLYDMGSASRNLSFPPGIFGWVTTDNPKWGSDYHMNYNHVSPFYGLGVANRIEQLDPCIEPILDAAECCRALARSQLGVEGVYMPVAIGPKGSVGRAALMQKSNAAYSCVPIAERWYTTYDPAFARKAYPFVRDTALFWENWLQLEDGRYVIYKDAVHENSGEDMNPIVSLALVRMVMNLALDMSGELKIDSDRHRKWNHIRDHLSDYPTCRLGDLTKWWPKHLPKTEENRNLPIFRYAERGTEWWRNNTVGIQHIFPAGGIGLDSNPDLLERGRNQIMVMQRWVDFNGMNSMYAAAIRVGYDPEIILSEMKKMLKKIGGANGMITGNPHGIEHLSTVPNAIQEMLIQSYEGVIRVFPVWPKDQNARFGGLRAKGAFLVSSELKDGEVQQVTIISERGRDCTIVNPWPGRNVQVDRNGKPGETLSGERFTCKTGTGETLTLGPAESLNSGMDADEPE